MEIGSNDFGQLGDGTEESREQPKKVKFLQTEFVKSVSCGAHCTAAIAEPRENDGTVSTSRLWVWGQNQVSTISLSFCVSYICDMLCRLGHKLLILLFISLSGIKLSTSILGCV